MRQAQDCTDGETTFNKFPGITVDSLSVLLANPVAPWAYVYQSHALPVNPDGTISLTVPAIYSGNYYIAIRHRSSIETWSALPVLFSGSTITYNFTTAAAQAFGSNQKNVSEGGSVYAFYTGDVSSPAGSQDGYIDIFDNNGVFNQSQLGNYGYTKEDLSGDGFVDIFDIVIVFNNMQNSVGMITPPNPGKKK